MFGRVNQDDGRALRVEALIDNYGAEVLSFIQAHVADEAVAEEAFLTVFAQAYRRYHTLRAGLAPGPWLLTIAATVCTHGTAVGRADVIDGSLLRARASLRLRATVALVDAERRHRGPAWSAYAAALTFAAALTGIGVGVYRQPSPQHAVPSSSVGGSMAVGMPTPLANLPVEVGAQFRLADAAQQFAPDHVAVTSNALLLTRLQDTQDGWPTIAIDRASFLSSGQTVTAATKPLAAVDLVFPGPTQSRGSTVAREDWSLDRWDIQVTGQWAILSAWWHHAHAASHPVTQMYLVYLPSGTSALANSFVAGAGSADTYRIVAGAGRVAVLSGFSNLSGVGGTHLVNLPIPVYRLVGNNPLHALHLVAQLPAPPTATAGAVLTTDGLVYPASDAGRASVNEGQSTWNLLTWDDQLLKLSGPPQDGQPHALLQGRSNQLWWAETTPDRVATGRVQVLMGPMLPQNALINAPYTLNASVNWFIAVGDAVLWSQTDGAITQLVVARTT